MIRAEINRQTTTCLVLVEKEEAVFSQISALIDETYLIRWYQRIDDAIAWMRDRQSASLIIVNEKQSTLDSLAELRRSTLNQSVPILLLCNKTTEESTKLALRAGVTDLISLSDSAQLERRIQFFLTLMRRVAAQPDVEAPRHKFRFELPTWKRAIDIAASLQALIVFSPLMLLVAILIKLDSKGPVFYKSKRVGANYRVFGMIKFRTMRVEADQLLKQMAAENNMYSQDVALSEESATEHDVCEGCALIASSCQRKLFDQDRFVCERHYLQRGDKGAAFVKFRNDPRITRLGNFLRNSSIDELPQLVNILLGDMSIVGNRPLPVYEAEKLTTDQAVKRFAGPSGLTGLWQVQKRARGENRMNEQERIDLDIEYVETFSFLNDMKIIYKTFFSLWQQENV
ncbi:sugar transferase [Fibrella aquatica]|jgi:lipopolysaccharide/colanic/teichoic acid biosynthesis glycosyltransferase|uniref:sugar transferase n=1 Tax=Fibrella aquatica TaxID=3242487 RepID=UPI0035204E07